MPKIEFRLEPLTGDDGITLAVLGMLVVFLALTLVAAFISILPRIARRISMARAVSTPPALPVDDDEVSEELLAVICAAVAAVVHQPHRIVHVRSSEDLGWSLESRLQHHQSHSIPHRGR